MLGLILTGSGIKIYKKFGIRDQNLRPKCGISREKTPRYDPENAKKCDVIVIAAEKIWEPDKKQDGCSHEVFGSFMESVCRIWFSAEMNL